MRCPKCESDKLLKDGKVKGRQRHRCKECGYRHTVILKSTAKPQSTKRLALQLYLEGLGFRSIGRILNVSNVCVLKWIRFFGKELQNLKKKDTPIEIVEIDEMHTYVGKKKLTTGSGLLLIDMEKGSSISLLATVQRVQGKNYGKKSNPCAKEK